METVLKPLPIDEVLPELLMRLKEKNSVVLQAEPGAGKTTRVAPAILEQLRSKDSSERFGQIVLLQPRRVAARAAAARISDERRTEIGGETGYQVRFEKRASRETKILVCTEGVFLRRLQEDPLLENVSTVIFDEFHERTIDSDLALALVMQVKRELRDDLAVLVMSATLDTDGISKYLDDCPVIRCPGRTFPIDIQYLQFPSSESIEETVAKGIRKIASGTAGDILAFLPGVGEIRKTENLIQTYEELSSAEIMPLYGEMPLEEQQKVLRPCDKRKIVLATNVAETSLTIDGVTAVIDSGYAKTNRLNPRLGLNKLELGRISKASANQRAGRAGRTQNGTCLRLWSEKEHHMLKDFDEPEISRVELSQTVLQLYAWGEQNPFEFKWFEKPPAAAMEQAIALLEKLEALENKKLTDLGKEMAALPLQPRIARLLVDAASNGFTERACLAAAILGERSPFQKTGRGKSAEHYSDSDLLDKVRAVEEFIDTGKQYSKYGDLSVQACKQIIRIAEQLQKSVKRSAREKGNSKKTESDADTVILRAVLDAFPDRVCRRRDSQTERALMVGGRGVKLSDESAVGNSEFFVALELVDTGQSESLVVQASGVERSWLPAKLLCTQIDTKYDATKEKVFAIKRTKYCDLTLDEQIVPVPADIDVSELLAESVKTVFELKNLADEQSLQYLERLLSLREWSPQLAIPDYGEEPIQYFLRDWCASCSSVQELRNRPLWQVIQTTLSNEQLYALESEAPERITVPSGSKIKLLYEHGKSPILAVRIQEVFGLKETPRIANNKIPVLMHLLAPNHQIQQITPDLASFWKNSYADVKKDLRRRYPKHSWPDDPLTAQAEHRPQRKTQKS